MSKTKPPSSERKLFAARLSAIRASAGFESMRDFADAIGVEHETYRRYERAETEPNIAVLTKIRAVTGVSLDFLVAGDPRATGSVRSFIPATSSPSAQPAAIEPNATDHLKDTAGAKPAPRKAGGGKR